MRTGYYLFYDKIVERFGGIEYCKQLHQVKLLVIVEFFNDAFTYTCYCCQKTYFQNCTLNQTRHCNKLPRRKLLHLLRKNAFYCSAEFQEGEWLVFYGYLFHLLVVSTKY